METPIFEILRYISYSFFQRKKKSTKFIFKQILNTVFGVFLKIDTRSHGLDKQNAIDMQIQSAKRNKNTSTRHSPFYKGTILIVKPSPQKRFVVNPKIDENSQLWTHPISNHART